MSISSVAGAVKFLTSFLDAAQPTQSPIKATEEKPAPDMEKVHGGKEVQSPESMGVSSYLIESFLREIAENDKINMHSVLVFRNGVKICEAEFGARDIRVPRYTFSACKSIVSLAVGILWGDGGIDLDEKVADIFDDMCPQRAKIRTRGVTVRNLLTMQSGMSFFETDSLINEKWLHDCLSASIKGEVGEDFSYNSLNTYLLSAIILRKTGVPVSEYLTQRLFKPMEIESHFWEKSPEGIEKGGWGLYLKPDDMAKLGQLVMDGGAYNGLQLVPREYIADAVSPHAKTPRSIGDYDYGYHIWVGRNDDSFLFNGMLGQNMLGFRSSGILLVTNGGDNFNFQQCDYFKIARRAFGGSFEDRLPADDDGEKSLQSFVKSLKWDDERAVSRDKMVLFAGYRYTPDDARAAGCGLMPAVMQTLENNYTSGLKAIEIADRLDAIDVTYIENDDINRFTVGVGRPRICTLKFKNQYYLAAATGDIKKNEDDEPVLKITLDFLEMPSTRIIKLVKKKDGAVLRQSEMPGRQYLIDTVKNLSEKNGSKSIISSAVETIDPDYIEFKVDRLFRPEIAMREER